MSTPDAPVPVPPPSPWRSAFAAVRLGALTFAGGAIGLWAMDVAILLPDRRLIGSSRWFTGLGGALLVAVSTALILGGISGPLVVPIVTSIASRLRGLWHRVRDPDPEVQSVLAAQALTLAGLTALTCVATDRIAFVLLMDLARPESMAIAIAAVQVTLVAGLIALWPVSVHAMRVVLCALAAVPGIRWGVARAWRTVLSLSLIGLAIAAWVFRTRWAEARMLPWHEILPVPGFILGIDLARRAGRSSARLRRSAWVLVAVCLALGFATGRRIRPASSDARRLGFERALSGTLGYAAWTAALDFDHDGHIHVLGGGDCNPFNPQIHVGAIDIADDGIDQDCDGFDAATEVFRPRGRVALPLGVVAPQPTVVLITIDALAADQLSSIGHGVSQMPRVDAFAATSALFVHAFSEGPSTRLSFPSMFTSRWDSELQFTFSPRPPYPLAPSERQIQDMFDTAGYETVAVVSHRYFTPSAWPSVTRGFQRVDTTPVEVGKNNSVQVTDAALRALTAPHTQPLYLWVHYYDAHAPYVAPADFPPVDRSDAAVYNAELHLIDREVGRLLDAIAARPDPTYVVLTADHGTVFHPRPWTRHGRYGYDLYTATLHVPLMVHGPEITPRRIEGIASTMDVAPTLADIIRGGDRMDFHGVSLVPEIFQGVDDRSRMLFSEFYLGERDYRGEDPLVMVSLRTDQWNFILDRVHGTYELYDWLRDPYEETDRFEDDARLPKVLRFRALISSFLQAYHRRPTGAALLPPPPR